MASAFYWRRAALLKNWSKNSNPPTKITWKNDIDLPSRGSINEENQNPSRTDAFLGFYFHNLFSLWRIKTLSCRGNEAIAPEDFGLVFRPPFLGFWPARNAGFKSIMRRRDNKEWCMAISSANTWGQRRLSSSAKQTWGVPLEISLSSPPQLMRPHKAEFRGVLEMNVCTSLEHIFMYVLHTCTDICVFLWLIMLGW